VALIRTPKPSWIEIRRGFFFASVAGRPGKSGLIWRSFRLPYTLYGGGVTGSRSLFMHCRNLSLIGLALTLNSGSVLAQPAPPPPPPPRDRDLYCRHEAAARTGYVTPGEAASHEQANGSIGGLLGGAALGAILGGRNAGTGAAIGAGVGLAAGSAIGASNAREAAADVRRHYADVYYECMQGYPMPSGYSYDRPPPPPPPDDYDAPPPPPGEYGPPPDDGRSYPPPGEAPPPAPDGRYP